MTEGAGDSVTNLVDVFDLAKNSISLSGLKDIQVNSNDLKQIIADNFFDNFSSQK